MSAPDPPPLNETLVKQLAAIASKIDGCHESLADELVQEFNSLAETDIPYLEFQGIYKAEEHEDYVRRVLTERLTNSDSSIGRTELAEMFQRIKDNPSDDAYLQFVFTTVKKAFGDSQVSDLVFWPGEYFGDGDNSRDLSATQMADAVLDRHRRKNGE